MPDRAGEASLDKLTPFDRRFTDFSGVFSYIGSGWIGGKAQGLAFIKDSLLSRMNGQDFPDIYGANSNYDGHGHRCLRCLHETEQPLRDCLLERIQQ